MSDLCLLPFLVAILVLTFTYLYWTTLTPDNPAYHLPFIDWLRWRAFRRRK